LVAPASARWNGFRRAGYACGSIMGTGGASTSVVLPLLNAFRRLAKELLRDGRGGWLVVTEEFEVWIEANATVDAEPLRCWGVVNLKEEKELSIEALESSRE